MLFIFLPSVSIHKIVKIAALVMIFSRPDSNLLWQRQEISQSSRQADKLLMHKEMGFERVRGDSGGSVVFNLSLFLHMDTYAKQMFWVYPTLVVRLCTYWIKSVHWRMRCF